MFTSTGEELVLCSYLLKSLTLSLSCVCFLCSLSASSFSSHTFSLPLFSAMLPRRLSLPSHALFFLIKSSLYRESLLWRWFKGKGWHKLHITVRPKQIPSAMVKFAALAFFQKAFYSRANICTPPLPYFSCHWTNMVMLPVSKKIVSFLTTFSHISSYPPCSVNMSTDLRNIKIHFNSIRKVVKVEHYCSLQCYFRHISISTA